VRNAIAVTPSGCRRLMLLLSIGLSALALPAAAGAVPPTLSSVGQQNRHPTATFSAPRAGSVTVYVANKPDRATDGQFLSENVATLDSLTDSEIQEGRWVGESQLDPGTYYMMLSASPDFDACWVFDAAAYDPACADGFSNVLPLVVPKPSTRYSARVLSYKYLRQATLELTAAPLGENRPYRVCYRLLSRTVRCLRGTLDGYSWNTSASDRLTVTTRNLPTFTSFVWSVGGKVVATKRVRVR